MKLKKAIQILESHQEWRIGNIEKMPHIPKEITEALNLVLKEVKKINTKCTKCQAEINYVGVCEMCYTKSKL